MAKSLAISVTGMLVNLISGLKVDQSNKRTTIIGLTLVFVGSQVYYWHKFSFWSRRNVKTPRPLPLVGNLLSFLLHPRQQLELEWPKKYGKVYGFYRGTQPYLVCADPHVLKKIAVKDFDKFQNHYFMGVKNKYQNHFLVFLNDDHWRGMRSIITPTFASNKIKTIYKILDRCATELVEEHQDLIDNGKPVVDLRKVYAAFTMGSGLRCFYGIEVRKDAKNPDDTIEGYAARSRMVSNVKPWRFIISSLLPDSLLHAINLPLVPSHRLDFFANKVKQIIKHRQKSNTIRNDYLQLLLDAKSSDGTKPIHSEIDEFEQHHSIDGHESSDKTLLVSRKMKLTETEVSCQAMMLMMVATETTAILLTHTVYLLAHHAHIQQTLYEELCKIWRRDQDGTSEFDYEQLTTCVYLDSVLAESLRLMTPALIFDRVANDDYYIEEYGIHVPKGTIINLAFYAIHRDPDFWPEPDKFDPERFMPENKNKIVSGSYCPFGVGPRSCVAFRFALTEVKIALSKLLVRFLLDKAPGTVYPPEPNRMTFVLNDNKNLLVLFKNRN